MFKKIMKKGMASILSCCLILGMHPSFMRKSSALSAGQVLGTGVYNLSENIYGDVGQSGLIIANNATVILNVIGNVHIEGGGHIWAKSTLGAGAGIEMGEGSKLYITGTGTLTIKGGTGSEGEGGLWRKTNKDNGGTGTAGKGAAGATSEKGAADTSNVWKSTHNDIQAYYGNSEAFGSDVPKFTIR